MSMTKAARIGVCTALAAGAMALGIAPGLAHKPITSPYTYNEDVYPVLRERCGRCHAPDGVAPMSLLTHADAVPWGESIRIELLAGHMPPWNVDTASGRFRNVEAISAREMNVLLTWATGGTPLGDPDKSPPPASHAPRWALGPPGLTLPFPADVTLPASAQEDTVDLVLSTGLTERRWIRAADLLPGTPSIVRSAVISVRPAPGQPPGAERVLAVWLPGDIPVPLDGEAAFELPAGAELLVRVHYKKTWQYEREEMKDRSAVGLYFAPGPSVAVEAFRLSDPTGGGPPPQAGHVLSRTLDSDARALAIYPGVDLIDRRVTVTAVAPDGSRRDLIAFRPRAGWARRYWFRQPIALARGTRIDATIDAEETTPLVPLVSIPAAERHPGPLDVSLTVNLIPAAD